MGKWFVGIFVGVIVAFSAMFYLHLKQIGEARASIRQEISDKIQTQDAEKASHH